MQAGVARRDTAHRASSVFPIGRVVASDSPGGEDQPVADLRRRQLALDPHDPAHPASAEVVTCSAHRSCWHGPDCGHWPQLPVENSLLSGSCRARTRWAAHLSNSALTRSSVPPGAIAPSCRREHWIGPAAASPESHDGRALPVAWRTATALTGKQFGVRRAVRSCPRTAGTPGHSDLPIRSRDVRLPAGAHDSRQPRGRGPTGTLGRRSTACRRRRGRPARRSPPSGISANSAPARNRRVVFRTTSERYGDLERLLVEAHPWDNPEVTAIPLSGSAEYLAWIRRTVAEPA